MTNDLIKQAEALIEKYNISGYIHRDATMLLPGLVAEIKRLRAICDAKDFGLSGTANAIYDQNAYIERLEKEFLDLKMNCCFVAHAGGISEEEIIEYKRKTAQAALDKIREDG